MDNKKNEKENPSGQPRRLANETSARGGRSDQAKPSSDTPTWRLYSTAGTVNQSFESGLDEEYKRLIAKTCSQGFDEASGEGTTFNDLREGRKIQLLYVVQPKTQCAVFYRWQDGCMEVFGFGRRIENSKTDFTLIWHTGKTVSLSSATGIIL